MISERQIKSWTRYCRESIENIKGYKEALISNEKYNCHHINELTFTKDELIKMNMYYHRPASELVIIKAIEHIRLHAKFDMHSSRFGAKNGWYAIYEDKHPKWVGDKACPSAKYKRALKKFKRGEITEDELQTYRALVHEYNVNNRAKRLKEANHGDALQADDMD
jgi:hypothetical protein